MVHTDKAVPVPLGTGYNTRSSTKNVEKLTQANLDQVLTVAVPLGTGHNTRSSTKNVEKMTQANLNKVVTLKGPVAVLLGTGYNTRSSTKNVEKMTQANLDKVVPLKGTIAVPLGTGYNTRSSTRNVEKMTQSNSDQVVTLKGEIEKQTLLSANLRIALQREREATLIVLQNRERELERERKDARDDRKKLEEETRASLTAVQTEREKLIVARGELKREKTKLADQLSIMRSKVDDANYRMESHKSALEVIVDINKKLSEDLLVIRVNASGQKRKMEEAQKRALDKAQDEYRILELSALELKRDNRKLTDQLAMMRKEVHEAKNKMESQKIALKRSEDFHTTKLLETRLGAYVEKRKLEEAHKKALDKAHDDYQRLFQTAKAQNDYTSLEVKRRKQYMKKKSELEIECAAIREELLEEKEKGLCQICLESPKDSICMPCLHFHYCSACLEKHKKRTRTCPTCRTPLSGTLKSDISS